ncbi:MAG: hypothetical protein ACPGVE_03750, partial [Flavobacteriales bacterium]
GVIVTLLISCKSDDDSSSASLVGEWIQVDAKLNGVSDWEDYADCTQDNITIYYSDNTFEVNEGATKCDPDDNQIIDGGTWSWIAEGSELQLYGAFSIGVEKLSSSDLILIQNTDLGDEIKVYFKRQ